MPYRAALPPLPRLHLAARTTRGPMREHNEDNYAVVDLGDAVDVHQGLGSFASVRSIGAGIALAVLDGMGGHSSGDWASTLGIETLCASLNEALPDGAAACTARLAAIVSAMSRAIWDEAARTNARKGGGATTTVALVVDATLHVAQVGDTRGYVLRDGRLVQITRDDSLVNDARLAGLTPEQVAEHELLYQGVITSALGMRDVITPRTEAIPLCDGDVLLLASDGLYRAVDHAVITETLCTISDPGEAALALETLAERASSKDNITVLVARVEGLGAPGPGDFLSTRNVP
jgi:protein phosphatase